MNITNHLDLEIKRTKSRGCLVFFIGFIILFFGSIFYLIGMFIYEINFKESTLVVSHSPNQTQMIKVIEVGEAAIFGASSIRLKYQNNHFDTSISNDGKTLDLSNVEVTWNNNEEATIMLDGEEQFPEVIKFKVADNDSPSFNVEYIELGYIPTYSKQDPYGDYAVQIRKSTYSKGSEKQYNFDAPVRVYYGPKESELEQYEEWNISEFSAKDSFEFYWNDSYVFIDVLGENDNGTTYVKDSLKIPFN